MSKRLARAALQRLGLDLVTRRTQIGLELLLRLQQLRSVAPYFFIQVGAQDGVTGDVIRNLVEGGSWVGILVEPRSSMFERLRQTYSRAIGLHFANCAIAAEGGRRTLYALDPRDTTLPAWAHGLGTFDRETLLNHACHVENIDHRIVEEEVDCRTWHDLLDQHRPAKVDLLQIDAEGMDYELVRTFPLTRLRPGVIRYEHTHLSSDHRSECEQYLVRNGYTPVVAERDTSAFGREPHSAHITP